MNDEIVRCWRCGRILKDPKSRADGIGEDCRIEYESEAVAAREDEPQALALSLWTAPLPWVTISV